MMRMAITKRNYFAMIASHCSVVRVDMLQSLWKETTLNYSASASLMKELANIKKNIRLLNLLQHLNEEGKNNKQTNKKLRTIRLVLSLARHLQDSKECLHLQMQFYSIALFFISLPHHSSRVPFNMYLHKFSIKEKETNNVFIQDNYPSFTNCYKA